MSALLLDTHALLWWVKDDPRLSNTARRAILDARKVYVSVVSVYEIGLKIRRRRIAATLPELVAAVVDDGFGWLAVELEHAAQAALLPDHHRDPWDRLLAAQSIAGDLPLVSTDRIFDRFEIRRLW